MLLDVVEQDVWPRRDHCRRQLFRRFFSVPEIAICLGQSLSRRDGALGKQSFPCSLGVADVDKDRTRNSYLKQSSAEGAEHTSHGDRFRASEVGEWKFRK